MISVMNNDFDLERNQSSASSEAEEARVSNDVKDERESELNLNEETRVSEEDDLGGVKSEIDETRVLDGSGQMGDDVRVLGGGHFHVNGDSGNLVRDGGSLENEGSDGDRDGDVELKVKDEESSDVRKDVVVREPGVVETSDDRTREREDLGSSGASGASSLDAVNDGAVRQKAVHKSEDMQMEVTNGDYKLERRSDLRASVSSDVDDSDMDGGVTAGSEKVMGTDFEMGDMVWGKVKSHPWWPGHLFSEAFASSSVRRTRRDGHILVAFFGDSSYGWFDPTELVPYDPHYAEKSQQTFSRNFMRAVEESVDEASRRSALGLSCRCRNPYNFRPTNVPGHLAVDVVDFEPGAVYSVSQIQKARASFRPADTLSFIKNLAAAPRSDESKSIDFIKQKATALAYRRSTYEEFDETYAQAFGQQPVRPPPSKTPTDKVPSRAPLSGPLVMADTLGGRKSSTKAMRPKELSKKDRYLFKRRDEADDLRKSQKNQAHVTSSSSSALEDGTPDSVTASYVFQKRDVAVSVKDDEGGTPAENQVATSAHYMTIKDAPTAGPGATIGQDVSGKGEKVSLDAPSFSQQLESSASMTAKVSDVHGQVPDSHNSSITSTDADHLGLSSSPVKKKKKKVAKRPAEEQSFEKSDLPEKKKKKLKKTDGVKSMDKSERLSSGSDGTYLVKPAGRHMQIAASSKEDSLVSDQKKDVEVENSVPQQGGSVPSQAAGEVETELAQMLADLHGLALNPFHGAERNSPAITRQFFLKFRSIVFLKSSSGLSPAELEPVEDRVVRSPVAGEPAKKPPVENSKTKPSLKPSKLVSRHEDPTKGGRKRVPSERQEEIAAKRAKKITDVKSLSADKRALLKNPETHRPDGKAKFAAAQHQPSKPMKAEQHSKKMDRPPRVEEPTYLVMKFQSGSSLPSLVALKARFARFGPMDTSLSRVFYKTNTCRVAFLYKQDANVAYRYAVGSKSVFSNVKFMLKPVAAPEPQQPSSGRPEDMHAEPASNWESSAVEPRPAVLATPLLQQQPVQQLKSCLKKSSAGDEPRGPNNLGGTVRTPRVRFNMGEDNGGAGTTVRGGVQLQVQMETRNTVSSASEGGGPSSSSSSSPSSSSVAMDVVSNNQRFMSSHPLQAPPPPQFVRPSINHPQHHVEVAQRTNFNYNLTASTGPPHGLAPAPPPPPIQAPAPPSMDISQQMMSLLTRCHDVVTNVKSMLGYVPYHPL